MVSPIPPQPFPHRHLSVVAVAASPLVLSPGARVTASPCTRGPSAEPCAGKRSRGHPLVGRTDRCCYHRHHQRRRRRRRRHTLLQHRPPSLPPGWPSSPSSPATSRPPRLPPCPQNSRRHVPRKFAPSRRRRVFLPEVARDRCRRRPRCCCRRPRTGSGDPGVRSSCSCLRQRLLTPTLVPVLPALPSPKYWKPPKHLTISKVRN